MAWWSDKSLERENLAAQLRLCVKTTRNITHPKDVDMLFIHEHAVI